MIQFNRPGSAAWKCIKKIKNYRLIWPEITRITLLYLSWLRELKQSHTKDFSESMSKPEHEPWRILLAPDKFKGTLSAAEAAKVMAEVLEEIFPGVTLVIQPMGDGGEGTAEILAAEEGAAEAKCRVHDPLYRMVTAGYRISPGGKRAYMEIASASGLQLLKNEERNCAETSSIGTGEMILNAIERGVREIYLCLGGSATNDGGTGMARALGYRFTDVNGNPVEPAGRDLERICAIDDSQVMSLLRKVGFRVLCDVTSPLTGPAGAAVMYGPQKGARAQDIPALDAGLKNLAERVREKYAIDIDQVPGAGAAGGLGGGAMAFLHARPERGIEVVIQKTSLEEKLQRCDLVITGEGKLDQQTLQGKTVYGIASLARKYNKPVVAICGLSTLSESEMNACGLTLAIEISRHEATRGIAMRHAKNNLRAGLKGAKNVLTGLLKRQE